MNLIRRKWRHKKREDRTRKKDHAMGERFIEKNTPEASPIRLEEADVNRQLDNVEEVNADNNQQDNNLRTENHNTARYHAPNQKEAKLKSPQYVSGKKRTRINKQPVD